MSAPRRSQSLRKKYNESEKRNALIVDEHPIRRNEVYSMIGAYPLTRRNSKSTNLIDELKNNPLYKKRLFKVEQRKSKSTEFLDRNVNFNVPETTFKVKDAVYNIEKRRSSSLSEVCGKKCSQVQEVLKTLQSNNEHSPPYHHQKFPVDEDTEKVALRDNYNIRAWRTSKSTNFDFGRRQPLPIDNFCIKGCTKIQLPNKEAAIKLKKNEYFKYHNGNIYKYDGVHQKMEPLRQQVIIQSMKMLNKKEVEMKDANHLTYLLFFDSAKEAKLFLEDDKVCSLIENDNKLNIAQRLMKLLRRRESRDMLEKKGIYQNEPIFGNTLKNIFASEDGMPRFITNTMELIERPDNIQSLGLYRTSGNLATIQKIRYEVDKGKLDILNDYAKDPDVLTGSLKLFFRELKEPLISCEVCDGLLKVMSGEKHYTKKDRDKIYLILNTLPECNIETLKKLIKHLIEVARYKDQNKMDTYNLSVCWGPTIIFDTDSSDSAAVKDLVTQSADATRLFDALLTFYINFPEDLESGKKRKQDYYYDPNKNTIQRHESRDSVHSQDSCNSKGQKGSSSDPNLSIDECLRKFVEFIELSLKSSGIYQRPGSTERTGKIMKKLSKKKIHEIDKYKYDVHELTHCLKHYLREYPESLITKEVIEQVNKLCDNNHCMEPNTRQRVKSIVRESPNKDTLLYLIKHLILVTKCEGHHKVPRNDLVFIWTDVLNYQQRVMESSEKFAKFLNILLDVFDESKHDETVQKGMTNGLLNDLKNLHSQKEKDRVSKYDNVPDEPEIHREATILEEKTELENTRL